MNKETLTTSWYPRRRYQTAPDRRHVISLLAGLAGAVALPNWAQGQEEESIWDVLTRNARKTDVNPDENTMKALGIIDTSEPILSLDTAYNIQTAMTHYQQVVAAGGWELALATFGRPLPRLAAPRAIEVEFITQMEYEDEFEIPPDVAVTPLAVPVPVEEPDAAPPAPADGMRQATELFTNRALADPQNCQVREALPSLEST